MVSSTFHVHSALKLAPILPQNRKKCRWCALSAALPQKQAPFYFIILIITMLPFNGNSMTSGEGGCITHCYGMEVELDGPKAFAKSAGRIFSVPQDTQNSFKYK